MAADPSRHATGADEVSERRMNAWIGHGVTIEGRINAAQDLRIDGRVEGTIDIGEHELVLGPGAHVKANITGKSIQIGGTVIGNVAATDRIQIQATASVEGDVTTPRLIVLEGATVRGRMDIAGKPRS